MFLILRRIIHLFEMVKTFRGFGNIYKGDWVKFCMNKKRVVLFAGLIFGIILISGLVSAQETFLSPFGDLWNEIVGVLNTVLKPIFGNSAMDGMAAGEVLFLKVLFFVIIFAIVWAVTNMSGMEFFSEHGWVPVVISIAVGILATRFLVTPGWLSTVLLPYTVLGIALASFIPLLVYFYFVEKAIQSKTLRKVAWILAAVVFFGMWISRYDAIGGLAGKGQFNPAWIYIITAVLSIAFFLFDGTIRRAFLKSEMDALGKASAEESIIELKRRLAQLEADFVATNPIINAQQYKKRKKELQKRISIMYGH